jgi:hypothetical protein
MNDTVDPVGIADFVQALGEDAADKDITREQRLSYMRDSPPGGSLQTELRMENLQAGVLAHIRRGDVLVFRLGPHTEPRKLIDSHFLHSLISGRPKFKPILML